jgi:hypothetical protein
MRWSGTLATLTVVAAALGTFGLAQAQPGWVKGSGKIDLGDFDINAWSGPSGENPMGRLFFDLSSGAKGTGLVKHLCVSGNKAVLAGPIDSGDLVGSGFICFVENRTMAKRMDLIQIEIVSDIPASCPTFSMTSPSLVPGGIAIVNGIALSPSPTLVTGGTTVVEDIAPPPSREVTFESLAELAVQYVLESGAPGRTRVSEVLTFLLAGAAKAAERGNDKAKNGVMGAFVGTVSDLDRFLTPAQMEELMTLASML